MSENLLIVAGACGLGFFLSLLVVLVAVKFHLTIFRYYADMVIYAGVAGGFLIAVNYLKLGGTAPYDVLGTRAGLFLASGLVLKTVLLAIGLLISRLLVKQIADFSMQVFEVVSITIVLALLLGLVLQRSMIDILTMIGVGLFTIGFLSRSYVDGILRVVKLARDPNLNIGDWVTIDGQTGQIEQFTVDGIVVRGANKETLVISPQRFEGGSFTNHSQLGGNPYVAHIDFQLPIARKPDVVRATIDQVLADAANKGEIVGKSLQTLGVASGEIRYRLSLSFKAFEGYLRDFDRLRSLVVNRLVQDANPAPAAKA
ncbi:MAG: mechanosensitive ion channel [Alphaproteobacteria bacterium]|nr:mechanosensitive ion channel [Alphaproteobacteria bacterium]